MLSYQETSSEALASSIIDWWKMAGVDYVVEEGPVDWLAIIEKQKSTALKQDAPVNNVQKASKPVSAEPQKSSHAVQTDNKDWPADLMTLQNAITGGLAMPGNTYGGKSVLPVGPLNARLMIIGDVPDSEEIGVGHCGVGASGRFLANMMKAIGLDVSECYLATLASTRPATGELPDEDLQHLGAFALHHISLVNPEQILILGSAACRALIGKDLLEARTTLPDVNHIVGKKVAISTFHPRTLLARPMLKAQAWKDLQMLAKKDAL
jgi:uracil-DNA glycosylase